MKSLDKSLHIYERVGPLVSWSLILFMITVGKKRYKCKYDMMQAKGTFATHLGDKIFSSLSHICTFPFISFSIKRHLMKKLMQNLFHFNTV